MLAVSTGCGRHGKAAPTGGLMTPPSQTKLKRNVELGQVRQEKIASYVDTVGYLDAEGQTDIAAGVKGIVDEVLFREGQWVIKDQTVLATVDQETYQAMVAQAEGNVKKSTASVQEAEETLALNRILLENLQRSGQAAKVEERQVALANVKLSQARLEVARSDVKVAQAALRVARHNLDRSQVRAPYTGQINQRRITPGTYLEEKTVIGTMADLSKLRLVGYIPERAAPMVRQMLRQEDQSRTAFVLGGVLAHPWAALSVCAVDQAGDSPAAYKLEFQLRPFPRQTFYGRIFYLSTVASPDTHMFECKAEVPTAGLESELRPGYTAKIRCPLPGSALSQVIPEEAVRASERGFIAFRPKALTRKDGSVEWVAEAVTLELGVRQPGSVEVLKGLKVGDWIVQKGAESLEDNTPIQPTNVSETELQRP
jgi:multidrug efflux system membrane fusion protein